MMYHESGEFHVCNSFEEVYTFEADGWTHSPVDKERKYPRFEPEDDEISEEPNADKDGFICSVCGKVCASQAGLMAHKRKAHPEDK